MRTTLTHLSRGDRKAQRSTTPRVGGRSLGTNLLEAALVAVEGAAGELPGERYDALAVAAGIRPAVLEL